MERRGFCLLEGYKVPRTEVKHAGNTQGRRYDPSSGQEMSLDSSKKKTVGGSRSSQGRSTSSRLTLALRHYFTTFSILQHPYLFKIIIGMWCQACIILRVFFKKVVPSWMDWRKQQEENSQRWFTLALQITFHLLNYCKLGAPPAHFTRTLAVTFHVCALVQEYWIAWLVRSRQRKIDKNAFWAVWKQLLTF